MDKKSVNQLACIPKPSGGLLLEAGSAEELSKAFDQIVKTTLETNLEVKGLNGKGKGVAMNVTVLKEGDAVLEASGETVRENLPEGNYLIRAVASGTGEEILFEGVDLLPDKLTALKAVFSSGTFRIRGTDGTGKGITVSCEIFAGDSGEAMDSLTCSDWKTITLLPGHYRAKVTASDSGAASVIDFEIKDGEKLDREISFAQGKLILSAVDSKGKGVYIDSLVYKAPYDKDSPEEIDRNGGTGEVLFTLVPGTYDILIRESNTSAEQWLMGVAVEGGKTLRKEISFAQGKLILNAVDSKGKAVYIDTWVYKAPYDKDSPEEVTRDGGTGEVPFTLVPGTYDILIRESNTSTEQWLKDIVIEGGKTLKKEISFAQGKLILNAIDSKGKAVYIDTWVYKAPWDKDSPEEITRDGGTGEVSLTLIPGTYDILLREGNTSAELWLKDVVIVGGKTLRKEAAFAQGTVRLSAKGFDGKPIFFFADVYASPAEEHEDVLYTDSGEGEFVFQIVPGKYDLKIRVDQTPAVLWEKDVEVAAGGKIVKSFSFPAARVRILPPTKGKKREFIFLSAFLSPSEENGDPVATDSGDGEYIQIFLVPGTYDLQIKTDDGREMEIQGAELWENEKFTKEATFGE